MAKGRKQLAAWKGLLAGGLLTLGMYLAGLLFLTLLLVKGTISERWRFTAVAVLCGLSALAGGMATVRLTRWRAGGVLTTVIFLALLSLAGLGFWDEVTWFGRGGILLLCGLAGGLLAGLIGSGRSGKRRRK